MADEDCKCGEDPAQRAADEVDDEIDGGGEEGEYKDYNAEYYHGEAKDGEQDEAQAQTGEQFMLGADLLVQPITAMELPETRVYLPAGATAASALWYDLHTAASFTSTPTSRVVSVTVHPDRVPAFLRGGAVLPRRDRPRRSSQATHTDPFTLVVAPDLASGSAAGEVFLDEYDGYAVDRFATARFSFEGATLSGKVTVVGTAGAPPAARSMIERIVFYGQASPRRVVVRKAGGAVVDGVEAQYDAAAMTLTVRQPRVGVGEEWEAELV